MQLSATSYVIIGMLGLGYRSGYEIKKAVESSTSFFWTISQAQIYPTLANLQKQGLIKGHSEPTGKRSRNVYSPTAAGERALREWLGNGEALTFDVRDVAMLKLFFAGALKEGDAVQLLRDIGKRSEAELERLRDGSQALAQEMHEQGEPLPLLALRIGLGVHLAIVDLTRELESELKTEK